MIKKRKTITEEFDEKGSLKRRITIEEEYESDICEPTETVTEPLNEPWTIPLTPDDPQYPYVGDPDPNLFPYVSYCFTTPLTGTFKISKEVPPTDGCKENEK